VRPQLGLLVIILVGIVAGWLAGRVMEGGGFGIIADLLVGLVGAFIGDWLLPDQKRVSPANVGTLTLGVKRKQLLNGEFSNPRRAKMPAAFCGDFSK
jgi:uncharacterized membrane protein YeaQ/YmgE (transglycosylase-associated protein family)